MASRTSQDSTTLVAGKQSGVKERIEPLTVVDHGASIM